MQAQYRGLGFDPTPGSVGAVEVAAARFEEAAARAGAAGPDLERAAEALREWWRGGAAAGFAETVAGTPRRLTQARDALRAAAGILDDWAATLRANQRAAEELDRLALRLRAGIDVAGEELDAARAALEVALGSAVRTAHAGHEAAAAAHERLHRELDDVLRRADELRREHRAAAERTAHRLRAIGVSAGSGVITGSGLGAGSGGGLGSGLGTGSSLGASSSFGTGSGLGAGSGGGGDPDAGLAPAVASDPPFAGLSSQLDAFSRQVAGLASTLLGGQSPGSAVDAHGPPEGAVGRFAAALAGR